MLNKNTIGYLLISGYNILKKVEIDSYQLDSQLLLAKVLEKDRIYILTNRDREVETRKAEEYLRLIELRKSRMPVKYILGQCEFMGYNFIIREGVLIPRPDTEILVETVISYITKKNYRQICDVCSGSGIIGITIARECSDTNILCLDISKVAVEVTNENIASMNLDGRVKVINSDLLSYPLGENITFDVIVSNPPYIKTGDIPGLMEDVRGYEPHLALSGGADGLDYYRKITAQGISVLNSGGMLAFEIGYDQKNDVSNILMDNGYINIEAHKDLSGRDRVVIGFKP